MHETLYITLNCSEADYLLSVTITIDYYFFIKKRVNELYQRFCGLFKVLKKVNRKGRNKTKDE